MVLSTHWLEEADNLCDYILILKNGNIDKEGDLKGLKQKYGTGV